MVLIHEKITALLEQRHLKKRDLARALKVSPQTATDICKGRSAITLPHLRNLVAFFRLRPDFWLDETRTLPIPSDGLGADARHLEVLARTGMLEAPDLERLLGRLRRFAVENRQGFLMRNPDLEPKEKEILGLSDPSEGAIGRIADAGGE
ncbi:MAG: hypothetical protein Fur0037_24030 [Planctomycetota bacterium]